MDPIESKESSWASSTTETPSASDRERLVRGLDDAIATISDVLQTSSEVREKFKADWDAALVSYQIDIGVIDEELDRLTNGQKRRKKKVAADDDSSAAWTQHTKISGPVADHSLNFYLRSRDAAVNGGNDDVFVLPPEEEADVEITLLPDELSQGLGGIPEKESDAASQTASIKSASNATKKEADTASQTSSSICSSPDRAVRPVPFKSISAAKKSEEKARLDSVSNLLTKMQTFREEEEILVKQLSNRENGMAALDSEERQELEDKLEQLRAKQTEHVVASVKDYKPRFAKSSSSKKSDLGLNLPRINDVLQDAMAEAVPIGPIARKEASKGTHAKRQKQPPKSKLVRDHTNTPATTQAALADPDHFLAMHELAIAKPKTGGPRQSRSLSTLVKCNTHPMNAMEMGRRNRVGR